MSVRGTIARNTVFNALGRFWEALIALVLTPYILTRLDYEAWGLWSLVAVFTGYASLFDFGLSSGFAKFIAEHAARKDTQRVSSIVSTGFCFYLALSFVAISAGWFAVDLLLDHVVTWFRPGLANADPKQQAMIEDLRFLFRGALVLFGINNCIAPFGAIPTGLQRMGVSNVIAVGSSILKFGATVFFLERGDGVRGLLYANALVLAVTGVATVAAAFALCPGLRLGLREARRDTFGELFGFGWRTQIAKLANLVNFQTDRVVIAWYGGAALTGVYRVGEELAMKVRQFPALLVSALTPAASDLDARDRQDHLRDLYLRSTKYLAAVSVPLTVFLVAAALPLLHVWLGDLTHLDKAAWVLRILVVGYLANLVAGGGMSIALGMGQAQLAMRAGILSMAANIVLTVVLVLTIGFYGVPIGTSLGMVISTAWFFLAMRRYVAVSLRRLLREALLWPFVVSLPGGVAAVLLACYGAGWTSRGPNTLIAGAAAAIFGISYGLLMRCLPFLDAFDVEFLDRTLRLGKIPGFRRAVAPITKR